MSTNIGTIELLATIDTSQYKKGEKEIEQSNKNIEESSDKTSKRSNTAFNSVAKVGLAAIATAAVAVGAAIVSNIGGAIQRVDTLNNANRTFQNLGFDSEKSAASMKELEKSIMGLPTPLDSAVRGMTSLSATYGDIGRGQKMFTALNNAILGFGGTTDMVNNAILQISQMPMDGPLDAQTWNSLRNSGLTPVLVAMAKDMGKSVSQMKADFGDGKLTVEDFSNALIKMNTDGGGGMKSLEDIAKDSTKGIGTSFANMNTAITRGLANVITAIGAEDIANTINRIGKAFENALKETSPFIKFIKENQKVITALVVVMGTAVGLMTAWFVAVKLATAAQAVFNAVMSANPIGLILVSVLALAAGFMYLWNNVEGFRTFFLDTWAVIKSTAEGVIEWFKTAWDTVSTKATEVWQTIRDTVVNAFNVVSDTVEDVTNKIKKWIDDWSTWIQNISIIIGTILLPKITQIAIEAVKAAAKTIASFASIAASAVVEAVKTSAAWVASSARTAFVWVTQTVPRIIAGFVMMSKQAVVNAARVTVAFVTSSATTLLRWGITFTTMAAGFVLLGAQAIIAGGKMALGMMLALGPIGLIIAAVIGIAALIIANWDTVKGWLTSFWDWLKESSINAWNGIKSAFSGVVNFFKGIYDKITGFFIDIGTSIGNAIGNAFKNVVNSMIWFLEARINAVIDIMNGAIGLIDDITPGGIDRIGRVSLPRLAQGGIVTRPTIAEIGEGGEAEAVIPLSKLDDMMNGNGGAREYNIGTINIASEVDGERWIRRLTGRQEMESSGITPTQSYMG